MVNADLHATHERWPKFAEAAELAGYVSVHALPLRLRESVIGALNLFCARPGQLSGDDIRTGQALADAATIGILTQRTIYQAELLTTQLQTALTSRVSIEQAKGVLAERQQITVDEAFSQMRNHARNHNLHLSDLARDVATGALTAATAGLLERATAAPPPWFTTPGDPAA
ncbi:MAG TPA: GAF and ANTAR domain-containing protein [Actinocrinis sp.]|nr:GAF and ANTAR domain-containing protein [Actinocrinis sp.]